MNTSSLEIGAAITTARTRQRQRILLSIAAALTLTGLGLGLGFAPQLVALWKLWTTDPLRSIGIVMPIACIVLAIRAWRWEDWAHGGTWWGLTPALISLVLVMLISDQTLSYPHEIHVCVTDCR